MFSNPLSQFWMDLDVWGLILKGELVGIFRKKAVFLRSLIDLAIPALWLEG